MNSIEYLDFFCLKTLHFKIVEHFLKTLVSRKIDEFIQNEIFLTCLFICQFFIMPFIIILCKMNGLDNFNAVDFFQNF